MKSDLPRYVETQPGDAPDAYFHDGARITPISRIIEATETSPSCGFRPFPAALAAIDEIAAAVAKVENGLPRFLPNIEAPAVPEALRDAREFSARLEAWRLACGRRDVSIEAAAARHEALLAFYRRDRARRQSYGG